MPPARTPKRPSRAAIANPPISERSSDVRDAALTLFAERGYHGTSMRDIAASLELQAASLYNHISTKQAILRDVMAATMTSLMAVVRSAIAGTDDTAEQLRRATEAHVRFHARHPREVRVGNYEIPALDEPLRSTITGLRREYSRTFVELIERGVAEGVFEARSPRMSAFAILQMGIGVALWYRPDGPLTEDDIVFEYGQLGLAVAGFKPPATPKRAIRRTRPALRRSRRPNPL